MTDPEKIVAAMMAKDAYSQWLGIQLLEIKTGYAQLGMTVRPEMVNGHEIAHGGISYSLADSALAFASNSLGMKAVSIETSINHLKPVYAGDKLIATATQESSSKSLAHFIVRIHRDKELVALFKGIVYRKEEK